MRFDDRTGDRQADAHPVAFVVLNGSKRVLLICGGRPGPVSQTSVWTMPLAVVEIDTVNLRLGDGLIASMALRIRFTKQATGFGR
jgi:hypothetical protein